MAGVSPEQAAWRFEVLDCIHRYCHYIERCEGASHTGMACSTGAGGSARMIHPCQ